MKDSWVTDMLCLADYPDLGVPFLLTTTPNTVSFIP
jgi:hypothetical protein